MRGLTILFPCYNEEATVEYVITQALSIIPEYCNDYEIIVVNDGSTDRTGEILNSLVLKHNEIRIVNHKKNKGYGAALASGFENSTKEFIFYTDADGQQNLREIGKFLPWAENDRIIIGYRQGRKDSMMRIFASRFYHFLIRFVFNLRVKDINCPFKLFPNKLFERIKVDSKFFFVDTEILLKAKKEGYRIKEIGVTHLPRRAGKSKVGWKDIFITLNELIRISPHIYRHQ